MNNKTIIYVVVAAIVVLGLAAYLFSNKGQINLPGGGEEVAEEGGPVGNQTAEGTSYVTDDGRVVNSDGEEVDPSAEPGSPDAPQQSSPIDGDIPDGAVEVTISDFAITPSSFEVEAGSVVTLAISSGDSLTHLFKFSDESLAGVAVGVGPGETRAITFKAPKAGSYDFICDVPGHAGRGATGTMTVK